MFERFKEILTAIFLKRFMNVDIVEHHFPGQDQDEGGQESTYKHKLSNGESGLITFETAGIVHLKKTKAVKKHGVEFFFFDAHGTNIKRCSLYHAAGGGRMGRTYITGKVPKTDPLYYNHKKCGAFTDNLPDWVEWQIKWGGGKMDVMLGGKSIKKMPTDFHGIIKSVYIGGCQDDHRRFWGKWRNLKINGEIIEV